MKGDLFFFGGNLGLVFTVLIAPWKAMVMPLLHPANTQGSEGGCTLRCWAERPKVLAISWTKITVETPD